VKCPDVHVLGYGPLIDDRRSHISLLRSYVPEPESTFLLTIGLFLDPLLETVERGIFQRVDEWEIVLVPGFIPEFFPVLNSVYVYGEEDDVLACRGVGGLLPEAIRRLLTQVTIRHGASSL
jgi:hypothetical protein